MLLARPFLGSPLGGITQGYTPPPQTFLGDQGVGVGALPSLTTRGEGPMCPPLSFILHHQRGGALAQRVSLGLGPPGFGLPSQEMQLLLPLPPPLHLLLLNPHSHWPRVKCTPPCPLGWGVQGVVSRVGMLPQLPGLHGRGQWVE